jgi:hypothetical protein
MSLGALGDVTVDTVRVREIEGGRIRRVLRPITATLQNLKVCGLVSSILNNSLQRMLAFVLRFLMALTSIPSTRLLFRSVFAIARLEPPALLSRSCLRVDQLRTSVSCHCVSLQLLKLASLRKFVASLTGIAYERTLLAKHISNKATWNVLKPQSGASSKSKTKKVAQSHNCPMLTLQSLPHNNDNLRKPPISVRCWYSHDHLIDPAPRR